jgi:hypothetical protein
MPRADLYRRPIERLFECLPFCREKLRAARFVSPRDVDGPDLVHYSEAS